LASTPPEPPGVGQYLSLQREIHQSLSWQRHVHSDAEWSRIYIDDASNFLRGRFERMGTASLICRQTSARRQRVN
jgi:hypothetical protein